MENHPRIRLVMHSLTTDALKGLTLQRQDVLQGFMDAVDASATATELVMAWREVGKVNEVVVVTADLVGRAIGMGEAVARQSR